MCEHHCLSRVFEAEEATRVVEAFSILCLGTWKVCALADLGWLGWKTWLSWGRGLAGAWRRGEPKCCSYHGCDLSRQVSAAGKLLALVQRQRQA